jgi:hypothetical protein
MPKHPGGEIKKMNIDPIPDDIVRMVEDFNEELYNFGGHVILKKISFKEAQKIWPNINHESSLTKITVNPYASR